ncbi:unnamed protein product [Heterobilharzia americana]|nr:unnamed protein product [Heterobilharzia americana]
MFNCKNINEYLPCNERRMERIVNNLSKTALEIFSISGNDLLSITVHLKLHFNFMVFIPLIYAVCSVVIVRFIISIIFRLNFQPI